MKKSKLEYTVRFMKAFNKYLLISWAVIVVGFVIYWSGFEALLKQGPLMALAQEEVYDEENDGYEEIGSVDLPPSEPIEAPADAEELPSEPAQVEPVQSVGQEEVGSVDLPPSEPISETPDAVIDEPSQATGAQEQVGAVDLPATEPMIDSSGPDVSVIYEPTPVPQPTPTPYQQPQRIVEREVIREVVRRDKDDDDDDDDDRDRRARATATPTPTPSPIIVSQLATPTPTPTTSMVVGNQVIDGVVRTYAPGASGNTCPFGSTAIVTVRETICDRPQATLATGQQVQGVGATPVSVTSGVTPLPPVAISSPTPSPISVTLGNQVINDVIREIPEGAMINPCPYGVRGVVTRTNTFCDEQAIQARKAGGVLAATATGVPSPSLSPSPSTSPSRLPSPSPSVSPSPSPSPIIVVQSSTSSATSGTNVLTIPAIRQETVCPAGSTRVQETDQQIICQLNAAQAQVQTQAKQIILTGAGTATASTAPKVIAQAQTPVTVLPNTGLPAAALGFGSLIPLGAGLRRWSRGKKSSVSANSLWMERQLHKF